MRLPDRHSVHGFDQERGEQNAGKIRVMDTCCICETLQAITTSLIYDDRMCYRCERILYRVRSGDAVRREEAALAERARAYIERKGGAS